MADIHQSDWHCSEELSATCCIKGDKEQRGGKTSLKCPSKVLFTRLVCKSCDWNHCKTPTGCSAITHNHKHAHMRCQEEVVRATGARVTAKTERDKGSDRQRNTNTEGDTDR